MLTLRGFVPDLASPPQASVHATTRGVLLKERDGDTALGAVGVFAVVEYRPNAEYCYSRRGGFDGNCRHTVLHIIRRCVVAWANPNRVSGGD